MNDDEKAQEQEIKIEKGIPIPPFGRRAIYPWEAMEVGDSFLASKYTNTTIAGRVYAPKRFSYRKQPDGSYRVWRVK